MPFGYFRYLAIWLAALIVGFVFVLPVLPLGLGVPLAALLPVSLCVSALPVSLIVTWLSNLLVDRRASARGDRARLPAVVGISLVAAGLLSFLVLVVPIVLEVAVFLYVPLLYVFLACVGVMALAATLGSLRFRSEAGRFGLDGAATLILVGLGAVLVWMFGPALQSPGLLRLVFESVPLLDYEQIRIVSLLAAAVGALLFLWRSVPFSSTNGLKRDAAATLCLVGLIMPAVSAIIPALCENVVRCVA